MRLETLTYDKVKKLMPDDSEKMIFFVGISEAGPKVFFYAFIEGKAVPDYKLVEQNVIDENEVEQVCSEMANIVKGSELYVSDKYNVGTVTVEESSVTIEMCYHDLDASLFRIHRNWIINITKE